LLGLFIRRLPTSDRHRCAVPCDTQGVSAEGVGIAT
jgi:hypothetical protein